MPPRAQPGEGIVVVVDVGPGVRASTDNTFYQQSKKCLTHILQRKMFAEKCRDKVGIVLFGTSNTQNRLARGDQYQNIVELREPSLVTWEAMDQVDQLPRGNTSGDWLDALVVAMDLLQDPDGCLYNSKKIVLMTDFSGDFSDDQATKIIAGLNNCGIELSVIGPEVTGDDDDEDEDEPSTSNGTKNGAKNGAKNGGLNWNGKPKSSVQLAGEALVARIVSEVDGILCSFDEAIPQLIFFQKSSAGSANWNTVLDVGPDFQIAITGRIKVKHATVPTWKRQYAHDATKSIVSETSHHRHDDAQTPVAAEDVILGYKYGTTLVPFSEEDAQMSYSSDSPRGLSVLGFARAASVGRRYQAGDQVLVVTAREGDEAAAVALSAFIQALVELDRVAITRRIYNKNSNPVMGVLLPEITKDYECFVWVPLPFQEDVRHFSFPSLQGVTAKLTDGDKDAMDALISAMNLCPKDEEDGEEDEELEPTSLVNPQLQHYYNCLTHRAIHPHQPLPPPAQHVLDLLSAPESVLAGQSSAAPQLAKAFPTKRVTKAPKDKTNIFDSGDKDDAKRMKLHDSGDMSARDLTYVTHVTSATPVQDFMSLLAGEAPNFYNICGQMEGVVVRLVEGVGGAASAAVEAKVLECLKAYRRESCAVDPAVYNKFLASLKEVVLRHAPLTFWNTMKEERVGLITGEESLRSGVDASGAEEFWRVEQDATPPPPPPPAQDDMEDLLDDL